MLQKLRVKNFRLLRDVEIDFDTGVPTVFVGPNGSGKSTVLEVLDFLARCAHEGVQAASAAHRGLSGIRTIGTNEAVSLETTWSFGGRGEAGTMRRPTTRALAMSSPRTVRRTGRALSPQVLS